MIWQVEQIALLNGTDEVYISINNGHLLISKQGVSRTNDRVELFLQLSLELFDQMMLTRSEGIDFVRGRNRHAGRRCTLSYLLRYYQGRMVVCGALQNASLPGLLAIQQRMRYPLPAAQPSITHHQIHRTFRVR